MKPVFLLTLITPLALITPAAQAATGDDLLAGYFAAETRKLADATLTDITSADDWNARRPELHRQLSEMLGLDPWPERTPLHAETTRTFDHDDVTVENLHFQSRPGLYVTANLYLPKDRNPGEKLPAVLYQCGHAGSKIGDVSIGNKTKYHHHGVYFARHGYACLMVDSLQLGEIEATHHGLYRYDLWWWNSRGYTPAGVEAWNAIRSVDYLTSRPEIDPARIGATGRSGGGIGSWWIAALDERIAAAVPVAGIANLKNHVVDGCVEGHCDCMYHVNTYRWDHALIAALVAPRPLLVTNSDKDTIFPLDGVVEIYNKTRALYKTLGAEANIGLHITEGPHKDTQPLRIGASNWFHRFLKGGQRTDIIPGTAPPVLELAELRVFDQLPADQRNTTIHDTFVPAANVPVPTSKEAWEKTRDALYRSLRTKVFAGWPSQPADLAITANGDTLTFNSQSPYRLTVTSSNSITLGENFHPRGTGPTAWTTDKRAHTHIRRRFALLGQTLAGMQTYDTVRALQALGDQNVTLRASGDLAVVALYASLFADNIEALHLTGLPPTHQSKTAPDLLNVLRFLDIPQALALAAERSPVHLHETAPSVGAFAAETMTALGTPENLTIH